MISSKREVYKSYKSGNNEPREIDQIINFMANNGNFSNDDINNIINLSLNKENNKSKVKIKKHVK